MRCPKCHYLSFDPEPRCKNCGYGLALDESSGADGDLELTPLVGRSPADDDRLADLLIRADEREEEGGSIPDWPRSGPIAPAPPEVPPADGSGPRLRGPFDAPVAAPPTSLRTETTRERPHPRPTRRTPAPPTTELPLFMTRSAAREDPLGSDEVDLHETSATPRVTAADQSLPAIVAPRPVPDQPATTASNTRPSARRKLGPLDRDLLEDLQRLEATERRAARSTASTVIGGGEDLPGAANRLGAAAIDAALIGGVSIAVLGVTLRWLDLPFDQIGVLPIVPTVAFLLIVGLGYLLMFTAAGGQTIGKMLTGIRVIGDDAVDGSGADATLSVGQAALRELLTIPSVLMLGAGFVPGLFGDQRAMHDRISHTRVVRA